MNSKTWWIIIIILIIAVAAYFVYASITGNAMWQWGYCNEYSKCSAGEGDCDIAVDCATGYCAQNVGAKYGQRPSMDVCEVK